MQKFKQLTPQPYRYTVGNEKQTNSYVRIQKPPASFKLPSTFEVKWDQNPKRGGQKTEKRDGVYRKHYKSRGNSCKQLLQD